MSSSFFLSFPEDVTFQKAAEYLKKQELSPAILRAFKQLQHPGQSTDKLENQISQNEGYDALQNFRVIIKELTHQRLLHRSVCVRSKPIATQIALSTGSSFDECAILPNRKWKLSRFVFSRRLENRIIVESPLSHSRIVLHHWSASAVLASLAQSVSVEAICQTIPGILHETASDLLSLFVTCNMVCEVDDLGQIPEDTNESLQCWEFHDLLFHSRSRGGRHDQRAGGTNRFAGRLNQLPVLKEGRTGETVPLYRPDLKKLQREDLPFARIQEERCSIRQYSEAPISAGELGEFLYRVGRIVAYSKIDIPVNEDTIPIDFAPRPYPAAGALYELEIYPVVMRAQNLDAGFFYYDPEKHQLVRISAITAAVKELVTDAAKASAISADSVQTLLVIAARFPRVSWKYSTIAYAAILKNLGVLYQTMYLAATAMELAPCAIGYGNSDLFAQAAGTDYYTETSVGEFLLGSKPS